MNCEPLDVEAGFGKGRGTRDKIANIHWIIKKAKEFHQNIYFWFIDCAKDYDCVDHNKLWKKLVEVMEFQLSYFRSLKMMLWKCCTQYVNKFGKLSSGHKMGKCQFSFPIPKKGNAKEGSNYCTIALTHMLAKKCSKFSKWSFDSMWTKSFQIFKQDLEKAEEPEIKLSTSVLSSKN